MTNPPEYDAPRTETQRLADDIAKAMRDLRRDWDHMLRPGETQAPMRVSRHGTSTAERRPDADEETPLHDVDQSYDDRRRGASDSDTARLDKAVSLRRFAQDQLNAWSRAVMEDRDITNPKSLPLGTDVLAMAAFIEREADWLSGQDYGPDCRDELADLAHRCHLIAFPMRRESLSIGRCPLQVLGEQDVLETCGGDVRTRASRLEQGEADGQAWAACERCGEIAVASWWEDRMFDDPETRRWLTDAAVVTFMHRTYGEVIAQATVRQWVKRGVLVPSGRTTDDGKRLFAREAVVYAIDFEKRRRAAART